MKCCYCKKRIRSKEPPAVIPEGFPRNPIHELKPLCRDCGCSEFPTLDEICERLDLEIAKERLK